MLVAGGGDALDPSLAKALGDRLDVDAWFPSPQSGGDLGPLRYLLDDVLMRRRVAASPSAVPTTPSPSRARAALSRGKLAA